MAKQPLILVVDDEEDFREIIAAKLKAAGFDVIEAGDGEQGVRVAKENHPDLIVMDVRMPTMDGLTALDKIRGDGDIKNTKLIFLTAFGDPDPAIQKNDKRFAGQVGADDYFVKSQNLDDLVARVRQLLGP